MVDIERVALFGVQRCDIDRFELARREKVFGNAAILRPCADIENAKRGVFRWCGQICTARVEAARKDSMDTQVSISARIASARMRPRSDQSNDVSTALNAVSCRRLSRSKSSSATRQVSASAFISGA
jgi:hypothetical protein